MARCEVVTGMRWPALFAAWLRRRLLDAVLCGVSAHNRRKGKDPCGIVPRLTPPEEPRSERLAELLQAEERESRAGDEAEKRRKVEAFEEMQSVVRRLQDGGEEGCDRRRMEAAANARRLAKDCPEARRTLAMLGAIPSLVALLDSEGSDSQISALYALLNLGIGNDENKSAVVKAGAVHKMLDLIETGPPAEVAEAIVANFLGLSALDANKPIIGASSGAIPFLVSAFQNADTNSGQSKDDALRAIFNLSISPSNAAGLVAAGVVPCLLAVVGDEAESNDRCLAVISNLVSASPEGRRALSRTADAFDVLVDVLNWIDSPGCQEKAVYILMVMVHKPRSCDRAAMAAAGITSALLELSLLGSPIAQKRASRILEIFRGEKGKQVSEGIMAVSAPIASGFLPAVTMEEEDEVGMSEEKKAVKQLVQQSLQSNMRRIARRANLPPDFATSNRLLELTASSTSKSLPF
ncbi:hypothetical protein HPP92_018555 [Vanilla planifolia]|uniref:U-box domain-containing protein n=1 Tax=Vanilla planifolia TaxID=51239 RepID=A0A835UNG9_VANPL|nr:hypothetical protein HPP92_018555 [Vanilla planifolia]